MDLYNYLVKTLPADCKLTCVFDSCRSGTILDLLISYKYDGALEVVSNSDPNQIVISINYGLGSKFST